MSFIRELEKISGWLINLLERLILSIVKRSHTFFFVGIKKNFVKCLEKMFSDSLQKKVNGKGRKTHTTEIKMVFIVDKY